MKAPVACILAADRNARVHSAEIHGARATYDKPWSFGIRVLVAFGGT